MNTLAQIVVCVAGLLGVDPPVDPRIGAVVVPQLRLVAQADLDANIADGHTADSWRGRGIGLFFAPTAGGRRATAAEAWRARIWILEDAAFDADVNLAHEVAHYVLWAAGRPYRHGAHADADNRIAFVVRKYRTWCRPVVGR